MASLMHCHNPEFHFCPVCGGRLHSANLNSTEPDRLVCDACGFVFYQDPKVVACVIIEVDGRIVLLERGISPQRGKWVLPGGYVDRGEEVEIAAIRETLEECGLEVEINHLQGVYSYSGKIQVVVVYVARYITGELAPIDETAKAGWFDRDRVPWEKLAFRSTTDALKDYLSR